MTTNSLMCPIFTNININYILFTYLITVPFYAESSRSCTFAEYHKYSICRRVTDQSSSEKITHLNNNLPPETITFCLQFSLQYNITLCIIWSSKAAFTPDTCGRIQVLSSVLLADTSGYNLYSGRLHVSGVHAAYADLLQKLDSSYQPQPQHRGRWFVRRRFARAAENSVRPDRKYEAFN